MIRVVPFGGFEGFSDLPIAGSHFYSQGLLPSLFGASTRLSLVNKTDSTVVTGMGIPKHFALFSDGKLYAQDNLGNILKEATPGNYNFSIVRSPDVSNGAGLLADQYGNLLYAQNDALGLYNGSVWNDDFQALASWQHPMGTYEDLRLIGNKNSVACVFSDGSFNSDAFILPSTMTVDALRTGPTGILIGANLNQRGALILWDGNSPRSKVPWKWTNGNILAITPYGENWIVKTTREVLITNGVTVKQLFTVFDDPLSLNSYSTGNDAGLTEQLLIINELLIFSVLRQSTSPTSAEFGKMKPGLYLYSLSRHTWTYIPVPTGNMITADVYCIFPDTSKSRIVVGYNDAKLGNTYIAELTNTPPTRAVYVSEEVGLGRIKYQRVFFGPTDKSLEAAILNLGILNSITDPATPSFNVAFKAYDFSRQLWGKQRTNAQLPNGFQLQVDGSNTAYSTAQIGDEVTILEGVNAGQIAHITAIQNQGSNTETWTLDTTFAHQTETSVNLQVQPFIFIEKKIITSLSQFKRIFFNIQKGIRGKQFLLKFVFDNIGTNLQLEMQTNFFVFDDLGYDQT